MTTRRFVISLLVLAVSGLVGGWLAGWSSRDIALASAGADTVKARSFVLVDDNGAVRGGLVHRDGQGPLLFLNNDQGVQQAAVSVGPGGPKLVFKSKEDKLLFVFQQGEHWEPEVSFFNRAEVPVAGLGINNDTPALVLNYPQGKKALEVFVEQNKDPAFVAYDPQERPRLVLAHDSAKGDNFMSFAGENGVQSVMLGNLRGKGNMLMLSNPQQDNMAMIRVNKKVSQIALGTRKTGDKARASLVIDNGIPRLLIKRSDENLFEAKVTREGFPS